MNWWQIFQICEFTFFSLNFMMCLQVCICFASNMYIDWSSGIIFVPYVKIYFYDLLKVFVFCFEMCKSSLELGEGEGCRQPLVGHRSLPRHQKIEEIERKLKKKNILFGCCKPIWEKISCKKKLATAASRVTNKIEKNERKLQNRTNFLSMANLWLSMNFIMQARQLL